MNELIRFRSDIHVALDDATGSDSKVARGAWVVPNTAEDARDTPDGRKPVLRACMTGKHNSPFERGLMEVYVEAPGVVWWQLTRHRFMSLGTEDFSFGIESGRYKKLDLEFYLPPHARPLVEPPGFRPMKPALVADGGDSLLATHAAVREVVRVAAEQYQTLLAGGVAREAARLCLPNWALYCDGIVSARPLTWLNFFSKRRKTADTAVATYPQWEIEQLCEKCESIFSDLWPGVYEEFVRGGRVSP